MGTKAPTRSTRTYEVDDHPFELRHEVKRLNARLDQIADSLERSEFKDILENYTDPKKRIISNLMAGISRGLGLSLGTFVILGILGYVVSLFVNVPVIGEYLAEIKKYIDASS
ncbi:hypothetical protein KIH86_20415 [Paenibacillus sp. HN-1]|uniref:DUF5665 domain-containing protein n=1 Tax=Paenibacillus TaxID=44249 RepID=UPI001DFF16F7|nr:MULTISPECIES: DUF5665 domain-containing protein [Paenibacillus]MBY9077056.1 hypothetical protein [Paenibacillus sp. CGMCC 1.18879]MBY9086571.1 hypothetical protein [Paenibacillus sinensis]